MKTHFPYWLALAAIFTHSIASAGEIHSNGLGGGLWSEANSWNGRKVPTATDIVVIAAKDTIIFDRDDTGKNTCKEIHIDPNGALTFQNASANRILCVDGIIESYGTFKMDASASDNNMEVRMVSQIPTERVIRLLRNSSLIVSGHDGLGEGKCNALLISWPPGEGKPLIPCKITAGERVVIDIQRTELQHIEIAATTIDNTGSKPNERLNIVGNRFVGLSSLALSSCDTPFVKRNLFLAFKEAPVGVAAIAVNSCPLAEVHGNKILGPYPYGISAIGECSVNGNTIEKCGVGLYWYAYNAMAKQNVIRESETAIYLTTVTGTFEDIVIDRCKTGISATSTIAQFTNVEIKNVEAGGHAISLDVSSVTLLNCNLKPNEILFTKTPNPQEDLPLVDSMQFLVVTAKGTVPPKTQVEVKTVQTGKPLAEGAADLNVRNSPADILPSGHTRLPVSLSPLILRSWKIERDGKIVPAPNYTLSVWVPPTSQDAKPKVLLNKTIKPEESWFRAKPNDPDQTMEVTLP